MTPSFDDVRGQGPDVQRLNQLWRKLLAGNGVFEYVDTNETSQLQLSVPPDIREEVLQELHAGELGGHLVEEKTLGKVK